MILIIPRNDGLQISIHGEIHYKHMTPEQMMHMGIRFHQAAIEMLRIEQQEDLYPDHPLDLKRR